MDSKLANTKIAPSNTSTKTALLNTSNTSNIANAPNGSGNEKDINVMLTPFSFLSTPAIITLIAYVILALILILPFDVPVKDPDSGVVRVIPYNFLERLLILLLLVSAGASGLVPLRARHSS